MESLLQIVALLAVIGGSAASEYRCPYSHGILNCTSQGLKLPPAGYWPGVTWLFLEDNTIANFPINTLSGFPDLVSLYSPNANLKEMDFGVLAGTPNLQVLNLQFNNIADLTASEEELENVEDVFLYDNNITEMEVNTFINFRSLVELSMHKNPLRVKPGQPILNHPKLEALWLGMGGDLGALDAASLAGLPNLRSASLVSANITGVSGAFAGNALLERLLLSGNPITRITSGAFAATAALKELYLDGTLLIRLDTAAVSKAVPPGGVISIANTPLACLCAYEALYWWAAANKVTLDTSCAAQTQSDCAFTRRLGSLGRAPTPTRAQLLGLLDSEPR